MHSPIYQPDIGIRLTFQLPCFTSFFGMTLKQSCSVEIDVKDNQNGVESLNVMNGEDMMEIIYKDRW